MTKRFLIMIIICRHKVGKGMNCKSRLIVRVHNNKCHKFLYKGKKPNLNIIRIPGMTHGGDKWQEGLSDACPAVCAHISLTGDRTVLPALLAFVQIVQEPEI